jgi:hypothetical protein
MFVIVMGSVSERKLSPHGFSLLQACAEQRRLERVSVLSSKAVEFIAVLA